MLYVHMTFQIMNKITFTNKHYTKLGQLLGQEFNRLDFLHWLNSLHPVNKFEIPVTVEEGNKFFFGKSENLKIKGLPELDIYLNKQNEKQLSLSNFILKEHGFYREPIIKILKEDFSIDYWQELINLLESRHKPHLEATSTLIRYLPKNNEFAQKNARKIEKIVVDNIGKQNKTRNLNILMFFDYALDNTDIYDNNWIIKTLNKFLDQEINNSKSTTYHLDKISKKLQALDFSEEKPSKELKKLLKGQLDIEYSEPLAFFWKMDLSRFSHKNKLNMDILIQNITTCIPVVEMFLEQQEEIFDFNINKAKNIVKLTVMHESPGLNSKLKKMMTAITDMALKGDILEHTNAEKILLYLNLSEDLQINQLKEKRLKI